MICFNVVAITSDNYSPNESVFDLLLNKFVTSIQDSRRKKKNIYPIQEDKVLLNLHLIDFMPVGGDNVL